MLAKYFWITGSIIYIILGSLHLLYTFFTTKFFPKDKSVLESMRQTHPRLTNETTMWKAWIGFNGSHSAGALFFGTVNLILAAGYFWFLADTLPLIFLSIIASLFYLFLAIRYWFKIPLAGIGIATICYIVSALIITTR
jgi:hypothetical protein